MSLRMLWCWVPSIIKNLFPASELPGYMRGSHLIMAGEFPGYGTPCCCLATNHGKILMINIVLGIKSEFIRVFASIRT